MMITDAIREAQSEYAVYFLLTDYVETLQFSEKFPAQVVASAARRIRRCSPPSRSIGCSLRNHNAPDRYVYLRYRQ